MQNFTKKPGLLFFLVMLGFTLNAQSISHSVIGSAGSIHISDTGNNIHWTVGEVAVERYDSGISLWQGFHQMYYDHFITPVWEAPTSIELKVFPNPTSGWLRLENDSGQNLDIVFSNLLGQVLFRSTLSDYYTDFDLTNYPDGLYQLSVYQKARLVKTFKVNKQK
jgi:hypothetical protein